MKTILRTALLPSVTTVKRLLQQERLPTGPVVLHFDRTSWATLKAQAPRAQGRLRLPSYGILIRSDPFGGELGWLVCALKGGYCFPILEKVPFGGIRLVGCKCYKNGHNFSDVKPHFPSCDLHLGTKGQLTCVGACSENEAKCQMVRAERGLDGVLLTCACRIVK
jgi:hypothetical protein